jgi:hypothetical protein
VTKLGWYLRLCDLPKFGSCGGGAVCTRTAAGQTSHQPLPSSLLHLVSLVTDISLYCATIFYRSRREPTHRWSQCDPTATSSMPRPPSSPSPPPASFPFTAGNFDYPHASTAPSSASRSRFNGSISRALRSLADRPERSSPAHDAASARRSQPQRISAESIRHNTMHRLFGPPRDSDPPDNLTTRPSTTNLNRPRATPSERYLRHSSARIREARADMESAADLLDSLSDVPINSPFPTFTNTSTRPRSPIVEIGRQTKRRKLEHYACPKSEYDGFKYGYKGQVVSGRLKMEILSCDGGEYSDKDHPMGLHNVRNVLKNDSSVYCSESARCNLLLKHIGDAPFALEKIVIRAPDRGFTAPYVSRFTTNVH